MSLQGILYLVKQSQFTPHTYNCLFGCLLPELLQREPWDEASGETEVGQAWLEEESLTKQKLANRNIVHTNWQ